MTVRRLRREEHELLRALRLRALRDAPSAFGSSYEREEAFTAEAWKQRLRPDGHRNFLGEMSDGTPAGLVAISHDESDPNVAWLVAMWVEPSARGTGLADELIGTVLRTAAADGFSVVRLHVAEGNDRAERTYLRHGFARTGRSLVRSRDQHVELEMERVLVASDRSEDGPGDHVPPDSGGDGRGFPAHDEPETGMSGQR
jgi:GNAT superfamily N-acetyltransferase